MRPEFASMGTLIEREVKRFLTNHPDLGRLADEAGPEELSAGLASATILVATSFVGQMGVTRRVNLTELAYDRHAIPDRNALDKLLRYEVAIDRNLNRALDRVGARENCFSRLPTSVGRDNSDLSWESPSSLNFENLLSSDTSAPARAIDSSFSTSKWSHICNSCK